MHLMMRAGTCRLLALTASCIENILFVSHATQFCLHSRYSCICIPQVAESASYRWQVSAALIGEASKAVYVCVYVNNRLRS